MGWLTWIEAGHLSMLGSLVGAGNWVTASHGGSYAAVHAALVRMLCRRDLLGCHGSTGTVLTGCWGRGGTRGRHGGLWEEGEEGCGAEHLLEVGKRRLAGAATQRQFLHVLSQVARGSSRKWFARGKHCCPIIRVMQPREGGARTESVAARTTSTTASHTGICVAWHTTHCHGHWLTRWSTKQTQHTRNLNLGQFNLSQLFIIKFVKLRGEGDDVVRSLGTAISKWRINSTLMQFGSVDNDLRSPLHRTSGHHVVPLTAPFMLPNLVHGPSARRNDGSIRSEKCAKTQNKFYL